ncbi:MAG: hypothetical protein VSS75_026515, partial [Candidatus Parabeggiatoa sp.]|nr:hypothetical protein [Candidatus Parabeggiatoa sp.]
MRDLGEMGESTFKLWCSSVGLVANASQIDKTGWDFWVEFPFSSDELIPQDMQLAPIECKVQVKATDGQRKKLQITVSNLKRLIRVQMPSFYCFIEYDGKNVAQSAYLVHVGKELIEKTLKRIRELEVNGKGSELHKKKITIHYSEEHRLNELTGECLKAKIESYISDGLEEYVKQKNILLNTLGFENGGGNFKVTISEENPLEKMVDLTLGIRNSLNVSKFECYHQRFGIISKKPFVKAIEGEMFVNAKPDMKALITFKEYEFSPEISFQSNFYSSSLNQYIPQKYIKFRFKTDFFDLVFEPFNGLVNLSASFDNKLEYPLLSVNNFLKALTLFRKSKDGLIIEVQSEHFPMFSAKMRADKTIDDYSDLYGICEEAVTLCKDFAIIDKAMVSIESLVKYGVHIRQMYQVIYGNPEIIRIEFELEEVFNKNTSMACVLLVDTIIGNRLISCFVAFIGEPEPFKSNKQYLIPNESLIGPKFIAKDDDGVIKQESIEEGFYKFYDEL